ncbi:MAG: hypothetical protein BWY56_00627 [Acidobacteria bacterium ADurb.Bin340]|nr:MAG: hypothetical protein BWY56_00627 [Acidobacteria bacterium ADurb.Bin340]
MLANIPKRRQADAWSLETTTAPAPGQGSVAEDTMDYARQVAEGKIEDSRLFFFHRQASDIHDLSTPEGVRELKPEDLPEGYLELGPFLRGGTYGCTATVASSAFCAVLEATDREAFVRRNPALALDLLKG